MLLSFMFTTKYKSETIYFIEIKIGPVEWVSVFIDNLCSFLFCYMYLLSICKYI